MTTIQYNRETNDFDILTDDGQYLGSRATYAQARDAAFDYDLTHLCHRQAVAHAPASPVDIVALHTALVTRRLLDAVKLLAPLNARQIGQVALAYTAYLSEFHGFQKYTFEQVNENFCTAILSYEMGLMTA